MATIALLIALGPVGSAIALGLSARRQRLEATPPAPPPAQAPRKKWGLFFAAIGIVGIAMPAGALALVGSSPHHKSIIVDTLLAQGLGEPIQARVTVEDCHYFQTEGVRFSDSGSRCVIVVTTATGATHLPITISSRDGLEHIQRAGTFWGQIGTYNPPALLADRQGRIVQLIFFPALLMLATLGMGAAIWIDARRSKTTPGA